MSSFYQLEFEKQITELDQRIERAQSHDARLGTEIPAFGGIQDPSSGSAAPEDLDELNKERTKALKKIYKKLSPWNTVRVARHPNRPQTRDYITHMCRDFCELSKK